MPRRAQHTIPQSRWTPPTQQDWFRIENARGADTHVYIYNEIGYWGITADDFVDALDDVNTGRITLHINSPGGSVFDGVSIYNALRDHPARVDVMIDGVAASAASFIAMAGDTVTMNRGSEMMVHNAHGLVVGDSVAMREMASLLDRQNNKIAKIYSARAGGPTDHWLKSMEAETWYDPQEAVQAGLADRAVIDSDAEDSMAKQTRAAFDLSIYAYAGRENAPDPKFWDPDDEPPVIEEDPAPPQPSLDEARQQPVEVPAAATPTPPNQEKAARLRSAFAHLGADK